MNYTRAVFLNCELCESLCYHLSNSCTLILSEKLITKLNNIIPKSILNYLIDAKCHLIDKLFLRFTCKLFNFLCLIGFLKLCYQFHHMFDNTHRILIKGKINKVLLSVLEKRISVDDRKQPDDFLYKMSGIRMTTKLEKVLSNTLAHELILLIICKKFYQGLNSMCALFVSYNIGNVLMKSLHDFESLCIATDTEQFLDHIVSIFMGN